MWDTSVESSWSETSNSSWTETSDSSSWEEAFVLPSTNWLDVWHKTASVLPSTDWVDNERFGSHFTHIFSVLPSTDWAWEWWDDWAWEWWDDWAWKWWDDWFHWAWKWWDNWSENWFWFNNTAVCNSKKCKSEQEFHCEFDGSKQMQMIPKI